MNQFLGLILFVLACGCKKEKILSPPTPQGPGIDYLEVKWSKDLVLPEAYSTLMSPPLLSGGRVAISVEFPVEPYNAGSFLFLDTSSGQIVDFWNDFINGDNYYNSQYLKNTDNLILAAGQKEVDCINTSSVSTHWGSMVQGGFPGIYLFGQELYKVADIGNDITKIIKTDIQTGIWSTVFQYSKIDKWKPDFVGIVKATASTGDELLMFKNRGWTASQDQVEIFCYNLTHDSLMWKTQSFPVFVGTPAPRVKDDVLYSLLDHQVIAVNILDGSILWEADTRLNHQCPQAPGGSSGDVFINGDRVIVATNYCAEIVVLNRNTGQQIKRWYRDPELDWSQYITPFIHFDGKIYFTSDGRLEILDDYTGEPLLDWKRTLHLEHIQPGVAVDSTAKSIYVQNGKKLYCLRIPDDLR